MKITILQGAFLPVPPLRGGAIEKAWQALGEAFVRAGHEVTHISRLCDMLPSKEEIQGVQHLRIKGEDSCKNSTILKFREFSYVWRARKILPAADILITHAFWAPLLLNPKKYGKIYVHVGRYPKGQMRFYTKVARFQAPSRVVANAISKELPDRDDRVLTIPYPLPFSADQCVPIEHRPKRVLYTGRIHPEKGVLELVRAWRKLPDEVQKEWSLRLVGPWREEQGGAGKVFLEKIKSEANHKIEIKEPVFEEKDLIKQYQKARIFVYPSQAKMGETFGLAVLEAMSCGCVPLVSSLECFSDFIEDGVNGIRIKADTKSFENSLLDELRGLLNSTEVGQLSEQALQTVEAYEVEKVAVQYLMDFENLIGK